MSLEILKQHLLSRWKQAFHEFDRLQEYKTRVSSEKYIPGFRYNLEDYGTPAFLQPEEKLFPVAAVREINDYHFYGIAADGLPCYTSYGHAVDNVFWEGYYSYGKEWVEYVEYNTGTKIPSCIKRIQYDENGQKVAWQFLRVIGRGEGDVYMNMNTAEKIDSIIDHQHSLFCNIEKYELSAGRIEKGHCLSITPGTGESEYENIYKYNSDGILDEIRAVDASGASKLSYARPEEKLNIHTLMATVAENMAIAVADALETHEVEAPLSLLELSYHYADVYIPSLSPRSVAFTRMISKQHPDEDIFDLIFLATELDHAYLDIAPEKFERPFIQLMQIISREEKWEMGSVLLRKVAHILTTERLFGRLPVGEEFAAYAVDWGMEMEDFEDVLRECGVTGKVISSWKERGWL
ncbi:hypothetical protein [Chitinophaga filiformis]|uniref:Uncharacterized protein n=1 Tax=Chitinophaga filiformis TaxID=104663 RepID=A0A1G7N779_CHIFI|nr:hypothetical protein [Chitinophaga filiformis]SDF69938.1 hypothetical protein SAMN04488121_102693 [Chitinophaga filiformis]